MLEKICFFHPSKTEFGGAELLVIRLARELSSQGIRISVIDYREGNVISRLSDINNIQFIQFEDGKSISLKTVKYMVTFSLWLEHIRKRFIDAEEVIALVWCIHPYHIFDMIKPLPRWLASIIYRNHIRKISELFAIMNKAGGLKFMDFENYYIPRGYFYLPFEPSFIQIPVSFPVNTEQSVARPDEINIAWIGRLSIEKVNVLIYALDQVITYCSRNRVRARFFIIGSGSAEEKLNEYSKKNEDIYVKIIREKSILPEDIPLFLSSINLYFAMGTAALEGGAKNIPTILLDYSKRSYRQIRRNGYKFKWLYQTNNFNLGSNIFKSYSYLKEIDSMTINDVFNIIEDPDRSKEVADACYNYTAANHKISIVANILKDNLEKCELKVGRIISFDISKNLFERAADRLYLSVKLVKRFYS